MVAMEVKVSGYKSLKKIISKFEETSYKSTLMDDGVT